MMSKSVNALGLILALGATFLTSNASAVGGTRLAEGKPCYSTERTFYAEDGVTPFQCEASGGPAYSFKVYVGKQLLWEGALPTTAASVHFELPEGSEGKPAPQLVVARDLSADPEGRVVFFGEEHLQAIMHLQSGDGQLHVPTINSIGLSVRVKDAAVVDPVGPIAGSLVDFSAYRFEVRAVN